MFLSRVLCPDGRTALALRQGSEAALVQGEADLAALFQLCADTGEGLADLLLRRGLGAPVDIAGLLGQGRILSPVPDGEAVLLPAGPGDVPSVPVLPPGAGLGIPAGGALEGGVAAVMGTDHVGLPRFLGWVQTHGGVAGGGTRRVACGPELCLGLAEGPGAGHARLTSDGAVVAEFPVPDSDRRLPDLPAQPVGAVVLYRLSRWLLRPRGDQLETVVESGIAGLGLALRNPLGGLVEARRKQA